MALRREDYIREGLDFLGYDAPAPAPEPVTVEQPRRLTRAQVDEARRQRALARRGFIERNLDFGLAGARSGLVSARGLARNILGPEGSGNEDLMRAVEIQEQAAAEGPRIQRIEDIEGVGDALEYAAGTVIQQIPNVAMMIGTGGLTGLAARGAAAYGRRRALRGLAEEMAERRASRAAGQAVTDVPRDVLQRSMRSVNRLAGPARPASETATRVGAAAGGVTLQAGQMAEAALDDTQGGTAQERSLKAAAGALATGAVESMPIMGLLRRFGLAPAEQAAKNVFSGDVVTRMAKAAGVQAGSEGLTELVQTAGELATHKWINDNVDMLDDDALSAYINAVVGGAVGGAAFGAPAGLRSANREDPRLRESLGRGWEKVQEALRPRRPDPDVPADAETDTSYVSPVRETADAVARGVKTVYDDIKEGLKEGWEASSEFNSEVLDGIDAEPYDVTVVDGEGVLTGAPLRDFVNKPRALELAHNMQLPRQQAMFASPIESDAEVNRLQNLGAFEAAQKAFFGWDLAKLSDQEKSALSAYRDALPDRQRKQFNKTLATYAAMAEKGLLERNEDGSLSQVYLYQPESAGPLARTSESEDSQQRAAEQAERAAAGIFEPAPEVRQNVVRALRGAPVRGTGGNAVTMFDEKGRRRAVNLGAAIQELRKDPAFVASIRELPADRRTETEVLTALSYLAETGQQVDVNSIRSGVPLDAEGNWKLTKPAVMRIRAGLGDEQAINIMAQRGARQPRQERQRAIDDNRGQRDTRDEVDEIRYDAPDGFRGQGFVERAPFLPGQGSPGTARVDDTRTIDSGEVDRATQRSEGTPLPPLPIQAEERSRSKEPKVRTEPSSQAGIPVSQRRRIASRRNRENVREDVARRNVQRTAPGSAAARQQQIQDDAERAGSTERMREASQQQRELGRAVGEAIAAVPAQRRTSAPKTPVAAPGARMAARMREQSSNRYVDKDAGKARRATAFIGDGAPGSSTRLYRTIAQQLGMLKDRFTAEDRVFVSINGARRGAVPLQENGQLTPGYKALEAATEAGATIVTDNRANRERPYNQGERDIAAYLQSRGYVESGKTGVWKPAPSFTARSDTGNAAAAEPRAFTNASAASALRRFLEEAKETYRQGRDGVQVASDTGRTPLGGLDFLGAVAKLMESKAGAERIVQELPRTRSRVSLHALLYALRPYKDTVAGERVTTAVYKRLSQLNEEIAAAGSRQATRVRMGMEAERVIPATQYRLQHQELEKAARAAQNPNGGRPKLADVLKHLRPHMSPKQQRIVDAVLKTGAAADVRLALMKANGPWTGGFYDPVADYVGLNLPAPDLSNGFTNDMFGVLVHEAVHAATMYAELKNARARKDLNALMNHVRDALEARGADPDAWYGLSDTQEFLAEAFSNPLFQDLLESTPALNTTTFRNAWEQFKGWVRELLGFTSEQATALDEILAIGRLMMEQQGDIRAQAKEHLWESGPGGVFNSAHNQNPADLLKYLSPEDRARLIEAFDSPEIKARIRQYVPKNRQHLLDAADTSAEMLLNWGVGLTLDGMLKIGTRDRSAVGRLWDVISKFLQIPSANVYAQQILKDLRRGTVKAGYKADEKVLGPRVRAVTRWVNRRIVPVTDALLKNMNTRLRESGVPAMREMATLLAQRTGEFRSDRRNSLRHNWTQERDRFMNRLHRIIGNIDEKTNERLVRALQERKRPRGDVGKLYDSVRAYLDDMYDYMVEAGVQLGKKSEYFPIVMDREALAANRDEFFALHREFEPQIRERFKRWTQDKIDALPKNPKNMTKAEKKELRRLRNIYDTIDKRDIDELIGELYDMAQYGARTHYMPGVDFTNPGHKPAFKHANHMTSDFIFEHGSLEQKRRFAKFQSKNLAGVLAGYTNRATRRAEWERLNLTEEIDRLMIKARDQGASSAQLEMMRDYVNMEMGTYNDDWHPVIKRLMVGIDRMFDTKLAESDFQKAKGVIGALQTYNNVRLLPLALLSSLVDPIAISIRSGTPRGAFKSLREGLRAYRNKEGDDALRAMAEQMGIIEREGLSDLTAALYGNIYDPDSRTAKVNSWVFRLNGMEAMLRFTRLSALAAGHRFLIKHKTQPNKHSERYLRELGLTPSMIRVTKNGRFVVMTPQIEAALRRFVDESTVRPTPGQKPSWHNDPNFSLAAQYKGYLYAFYETVLKRIGLELSQGNPAVMAPMLAYIPVTMMAEMTRDLLQDDGDEKEAEDYLSQSIERSGLLGPRLGVLDETTKNVKYGNAVTGTLGGATGQQIGDAYSVLSGSGSFGAFFEEALPGQALYKNWGDD